MSGGRHIWDSFVWAVEVEAVHSGDAKNVIDTIIDTVESSVRKIDWIIIQGNYTPVVRYYLGEGIETGTPCFVESVESVPNDCRVQQFPAITGRESISMLFNHLHRGTVT